MQHYVIGVDGGNTKTDFLLFTAEGQFVDVLRGPTCSHEVPSIGFDGALALHKQFIDTLLQRNQVTLQQVGAAAFGLAGVDLPYQQRALTQRLATLGIPHIAIGNDSVLGIKAAAAQGYGVCSVNGTGTVTLGIDPSGRIQQVGGIGGPAGDAAGAMHIALTAVARVHNMLYRAFPRTPLCDGMLALFGVHNAEEYLQTVHDGTAIRANTKEINILVQQYANQGDAAAQDILNTVGVFLGQSAVGCIGLLDFPTAVDIVLVGSVWVKCLYPGMKQVFTDLVTKQTQKQIRVIPLDSPPATGAVVWAMALQDPSLDYAATRARILPQLTNQAYEQRLQLH